MKRMFFFLMLLTPFFLEAQTRRIRLEVDNKGSREYAPSLRVKCTHKDGSYSIITITNRPGLLPGQKRMEKFNIENTTEEPSFFEPINPLVSQTIIAVGCADFDIMHELTEEEAATIHGFIISDTKINVSFYEALIAEGPSEGPCFEHATDVDQR